MCTCIIQQDTVASTPRSIQHQQYLHHNKLAGNVIVTLLIARLCVVCIGTLFLCLSQQERDSSEASHSCCQRSALPSNDRSTNAIILGPQEEPTRLFLAEPVSPPVICLTVLYASPSASQHCVTTPSNLHPQHQSYSLRHIMTASDGSMALDIFLRQSCPGQQSRD